MASPPSSPPPTVPRDTGRGRETPAVAARRGALDKALAAVLFQGGLRRSEAAALEWRDIAPAATEDAMLVMVRRSKTDQEGTAADVRYLKDGAAVAVLALRPAEVAPHRPRLRQPDPPEPRAPVHGRGAGRWHRRPVDRAQWPRRPRLRAHRARRLDDRRDAGRGVENGAHGRPLLRRGPRRTRGRRPLPLTAGAADHAAVGLPWREQPGG